MSGLRKTSSVNSNLGKLRIITGRCLVNSDTWTLQVNDSTTTLTDIGAGNVSLQFNTPFLSAPVVIATIAKGTHEAAVTKSVMVESVSTTECEFVHHSIDDTGAGVCDIVTVDPDDDDGWSYMVIGLAN